MDGEQQPKPPPGSPPGSPRIKQDKKRARHNLQQTRATADFLGQLQPPAPATAGSATEYGLPIDATEPSLVTGNAPVDNLMAVDHSRRSPVAAAATNPLSLPGMQPPTIVGHAADTQPMPGPRPKTKSKKKLSPPPQGVPEQSLRARGKSPIRQPPSSRSVGLSGAAERANVPSGVAGPAESDIGSVPVKTESAEEMAKAVMDTFNSFVEELRAELEAKPSSPTSVLGWREGFCLRNEDAEHMREIVTMVSGALPQEFRSCFSTQIRALADALFHDFEQSMGHSSGLGLGTGCFGAAAAAALAERINALPSWTASNTIPMGWISVSSEVCYSIWGGRSLMQDAYLPSFVIYMGNGNNINVDFPQLCALVHDAERALAISRDPRNAPTYLKWLLGDKNYSFCNDKGVPVNLCQNIQQTAEKLQEKRPDMGNVLSLWLEYLFGQLPGSHYGPIDPPSSFNKGPALVWMDDYETAIDMTTFGGNTLPTPSWFGGVESRPLVLTKPLLQLWQLGMVRGFMQTAAMADHADEVIKEWDGSSSGQPPHEWDVSNPEANPAGSKEAAGSKRSMRPRGSRPTAEKGRPRANPPARKRKAKQPDVLPPKECYDAIRAAAMRRIQTTLQAACAAFPGMWYTDDKGNVMSIPTTMQLRIDDSSVRSTRVRNIASLANKTVASASSDGVLGFHARALGLAINNLPYGAAGGNYLAVAPKSTGDMFNPKSVLMDALGPGAHKVESNALLPYIEADKSNKKLETLIRYGGRVFSDGIALDVSQIGMPKRGDAVDIYEGDILAPSYSDVRAEQGTFPICSELAERADAGTTSTRTRTGGVLPSVDGCSDSSKNGKGYGLVLRIQFPVSDGNQLTNVSVTLHSTSWSEDRNPSYKARLAGDEGSDDGSDDEVETARQGITLKTYTARYDRKVSFITSDRRDHQVTIREGGHKDSIFIPGKWIEYYFVGAVGGVLLAERNATMLFPGLNRAGAFQASVVPIPPGGGGRMGQMEFAPEVLLLEKASGELLVTPPERIGGIKSPITLHIILSQPRPYREEGVQLLSRAVALASLLHAFCVKERAGCAEWDWDAVDAGRVSTNINVSENMGAAGRSTQNKQWQARCWAAGCLPGKPDAANDGAFSKLAKELSAALAESSAALADGSATLADGSAGLNEAHTEKYCKEVLYFPSLRMFACVIMFCYNALKQHPYDSTFKTALNDMISLWDQCVVLFVTRDARKKVNVLVNTHTRNMNLFSQSMKSVDDDSDVSARDKDKKFTWMEQALGWTQEGRVIDGVYNFPVQKAQAQAAQAQAQAQAGTGSTGTGSTGIRSPGRQVSCVGLQEFAFLSNSD